MPQGFFKNNNKSGRKAAELKPKKQKQHYKNVSKKKPAHRIQKKKMTAGEIVTKNLRKAVNANIEDVMKHKASKDATSLKLLKIDSDAEKQNKAGNSTAK